ncbi:MAG: BadF/BadG/BcrA/BcrD ATPase family protein [Terracoccus sp.]
MHDDKSVTMTHHLGIDAGGTSTRAVVLDSHGVALGYGRSGSGNPISAGPDVAAASLRAATALALADAGVTGSTISSTAVAMAGGSSVTDDPTVTTSIRGALVPTGVTACVSIEKDLLALYFSGTPEPDGYALVAGTGAAAVRVRGGEVEAVCDGLGWLLGDDGSGFWIGREVARAVAADLDGRGPATALTPLLLAASAPDPTFEQSAPQDRSDERDVLLREIVRRVYALRPVHLARYAPLAFEAARSAGETHRTHDAVAENIVTRAGHALAATLAAVVTADLEGPLVVGGSVLVHQATVRDIVSDSFSESRTESPQRQQRQPVMVVPDGLVGAAVLALRNAGITVDAAVFNTVTHSVGRLR